MKYKIKKLGLENNSEIEELFVSVFTKEPWNDDWSNASQLDLYIEDLTANRNSLTFGLYEGGDLVAVSMGHVKHWYSGTEYYIDELCVRTEKQGMGIGSEFLSEIENELKKIEINNIFLLTEKTVPAYDFYRNRSFHELNDMVAFAKKLN